MIFMSYAISNLQKKLYAIEKLLFCLTRLKNIKLEVTRLEKQKNSFTRVKNVTEMLHDRKTITWGLYV